MHNVQNPSNLKTKDRPRVGFGALVVNLAGQILMGKRKNSHGSSTWALPGGHLEFGEEIVECYTREVREETGIRTENIKVLGITNDIFRNENRHYLTVFVIGQALSEVPELKEPYKCEGWHWLGLKDFPDNLFLPLKNFLNEGQHRSNLIDEINQITYGVYDRAS